ncbi:hypothetical protein [Kitasatospora sp. NPDC059327]|uniref:hypothetical protein n=1 Tax=Kitasatospora sp. NPDC059327 TaxID=3346803 RepID=UPI0036CC4CD4
MSAAAVEEPVARPTLLEVVIVDRSNRRLRVLTEPRDGEYRVRAVHHPGQSFTLPESAAVTLSVDDVLAANT